MSDDLKHKLEQWSPVPPPQVWAAVEEQLMQPQYNRLAEKMALYEAAPPEEAWNKIAAALENTTPIVQLTPRRVWMRYAAGIAAAAIISFFVVRPTYTSQTLPDTVQQNTAVPSIMLPQNEPEPERPAITVATPKTKHYKAVRPTVLPQVSGGAFSAAQPTLASNSLLQEVVAAQTPSVNEQQLERYIVVQTSEAAVKLPKKIYNFFRCAEVPDQLACAFRLNHLRMQAASPSLLATSDFTGLLEMVQHVK